MDGTELSPGSLLTMHLLQCGTPPPAPCQRNAGAHGWTCAPPPRSYVAVLAPGPQIVTVFGDRAFILFKTFLFVYFWLCWVLVAEGSVVTASGLQSVHAVAMVCTGLDAPQHVGSSWTRDRTHVPCIGGLILLFSLFIFNWRIIALQSCVGFYHLPT